MPKKWNEVVNNPAYQKLNEEQKNEVKNEYFDNVVMPNVPDSDIDKAREEFYNQVNPTFTEKVKTSFGNMADTVKNLGVSAAIGTVKRADNTEQYGKDAAIATTKSAMGVPEMVIGAGDLISHGRVGKAAEDAGIRFNDSRQILDEYKSDRQKQADANVRNADGFVDKTIAAVENPTVVANAVIESAGLMGVGGLIGRGLTYLAPKLAPVIAGATGEGITGAASQAENTRQSTDDGLLTNKQVAAAGASGLGTAFFGVGGGKVAQKFGLGDVDTILAGGAVNGSNKTLARKMVEGGVAEGVFEELPQSVQEQMLSNWSLDKPIMEGVDQAAALGMLTGGAMGAGVQLTPNVAEQKAERFKTLPNENLQRLRSTAERAMPADVPLIDAEIERRANTPTLTRAAEEGARVQDKLIISNAETADADDAMAAQLQAEYDAQPSEAIPASDILGDENVSDAIAPAALATEAALPELNNTDTGNGDIHEVPRSGDEYAGQLDSTEPLERSDAEDLDVRDASGQPDAALDQDWHEFPAETETLGVPRDEMPQIKAEHRGAMVNFLNARDISHEKDTVPASSLKPTQKEFSLSKVEQAKNFEGGNRSILVSSDGHILDGHHQWLSKLEEDQPIDVIRLNAPIADLIGTVREFPSATTEATEQPKAEPQQSAFPFMQEIESSPLYKADGATSQSDIDEIAYEPLEEKLNEQPENAGNQEAEIETPVGVIESGSETVNDGSGSATQTGDDRGIGGELQPETVIETPVADLPKQEREGVKQHVESIVKRRAAANQLGRLKQFDSSLNLAKSFMNGENISPNKFKAAATTFKHDPALANAFTELENLAKVPAKEVRAEKANAVDTYKQKVTEAVDSAALRAIAKQIQDDTTLSDAKAQELDDFVMDAIDALETDGPQDADIDVKTEEKPSKQAVSETGPKTELLGDDTASKQNDSERNISESKVNQEKIEDFGEKLEGAKKDTWLAYKDKADASKAVDIAYEPLSKSWPEPDYKKILEGGANPYMVAFIHAARDDIPTKPSKSWKLGKWVEQVKMLRDFSYDLLDGKYTEQQVKDKLSAQEYRLLAGTVGGRADLYEVVGHEKSLKGLKLIAGSYGIYNSVKYNPPKTIWAVEGKLSNSAFSRWPKTFAYGDTKQEAIDKFKTVWNKPQETIEKKSVEFSIYSKRGLNGFFIGKKIGKHVAELKSGFDTAKDARQFMLDSHADLVALYEKYKDIPSERRSANDVRIGADYRNGADVSSDHFNEAFGFRGVQFGNYVEGKRRQQDLNNAYDALMDLSGVLEIPPKAISLNGELGLAFGARGSGGVNPASAHYESGNVVINLTKGNGAGSLAHEWFHALDNYFSRIDKNPSRFLTESQRASELVRAEMVDAFKNVMNTIKSTSLKQRSSELDKRRTKEYWGTGLEMAARSFESYVINKLHDQNASNDYLANIVSEKAFGMEEGYPYPTAAEIPAIRASFDNFFSVIETKDTDKGVALFSRGEESSKGLPVREVQRIVSNLTSKWSNAPEILVVESMQDPSIRQSVRDLDAQLKEQGSTNDPIAFYSDGKVYILAPQVSNVEDVQTAVFHEILGHHGLRKVFGKELANILNELAILRPRDIAKKSKQYGFDTKDKKQVRQAAEEVLAEMAQTNPQIGFVKRAVAAIRKFLRSIGVNLKLTDNDIIANYLLPARNYVIRSAKGDEGGALSPAFSKTESFEQQVDNAINGDAKGALTLGKTPEALVSAGLPDVPLKMTQKVVDKIYYDHGIPVRIIKSIPDLLANPMMVFKSDTKPDGFVVVTDAVKKGNPIVVTIKANGEIEKISPLNIVTSAYDKADEIITGWIEKGLLLGADKEKALAWTSTKGIKGVKFPSRSGNPTVSPSPDNGQGSSVLEKLNSAIRKSVDVTLRQNDDDVNPPPDDPAFSRTDNAGNQWESPEESKMDNVIRALQNKHIDLKRVTENIQKAGKDIADRWNAYLQEELYHGRSAKRIEDFLKHDLEPLINDMRERGIDMADFEEYLWMRHAEERNKQIAKVNPEMKDGGAGVKTEEAKAYLSGLSAHDKENYQALAKRIDAITHKSRQVLIDYGLESADTISKWEGAYKHYVPLMREDMDQAGKGTGTGFKVKGNASRRATGSNRAVVDIISNIAEQYERNIIRGEKNRVATALIGLATLNPNDDFWKVDTPPTVTDVSKATGLVYTRTDPAYKNRPNVVVARIVNNKGEVVERSVTFEESDERAMSMAKAINNLDQDQLLFGLGIVSKFTRYFASINTQYNPIFGVKNIIRDTGGALLNLNTTPIAKHKAAVFANTPKALWGIYSDVRTQRKEGHAKDTEWSKLFEEFQSEGGQTGFRNMFSNAQERSEALRNALDRTWWKDSKIGKVISVNGVIAAPEQWMYDKAIKPIFDWLSDYNTSLENAVRLSVYKVALDNGHTKQQAASMAKNISVNFNRKGQAATNIGALYAFFNASVQGSARIGETILNRSDDGKLNLSSTGKKIVYGGMLLGAMQALLLAAAGFDEDEPPDFIKDRNLIIPDPTGSGKYISIPMPLGYNALPAFGRIVTEWALSGGEDTPERIVHMLDMFLDVTNPIGNAGLSAQTITPTFADPIAALDANKDFSGKPIYREDFNSLNPTPGFTRSRDKAWDFSVAIARGINYMTGGNDYKQGAISPTADQLEYLAGQFTGGVGREIIKTGTTVNALTTGEDLPLYKVPLVGTFVGDTQGQSSQGAKFYENVRRLNEYQAQLKGMRKKGESTAEFKADNPEAKLYHQGDLALNQVSKLRKRQRILKERGADKEKISDIDDRITNIMSRLNEKVEAAKERQAK